MFRGKRLRRSVAFLFCLSTPVVAVESRPSWDFVFSRGVSALDDGRYQDALPQLSTALELARTFSPDDLRLMKSMYALALAHQIQGQPDLAEQLYLEAKTAIDAAGPSARPLLGYVLQGVGQLRFDQGRWPEAEALLRQSIEECNVYGGPTHSSTLAAQRHLGEVLAAEGSTAEAEQVFESLIATLRQSSSAGPDFLAGALANLAALYVHQNRFDQAEPLLRESLNLASQRGVPGPVLADTLVNLGEMYRLEHISERAEPLLKKALNIYATVNDPHQAGALNELGLLALDERKFAIAKDYIKQSLRIYERVIGPAHLLTARVKAALAQAVLGERDIPQARSLIREALLTERSTAGETHCGYARLLMIAGKVEEAGHQRAQADTFYRQALEVYRGSLGDRNPERAQAEQAYALFTKSVRKD